MSLKRTELARQRAASITDKQRRERVPERFGRNAAAVGQQRQLEKDEAAIAELVATREAAWNAGDTVAYAQLLTEDADILSASGKAARGREAVLRLFTEQHARIFAGVRTSTSVAQVRMIAPGVALADVDYALEGGKVDAIRKGTMAFVLKKDPMGRWKISAIRSAPSR
jgi:uncharacterized protein (TIGR02246 family)